MLAPALHIPDGLLTLPVALAGWAVAVPALALALHFTGGVLGERLIPRLGLLAAFMFAAQAFQFPVPGGTTAHVVGAGFVALLAGPWAGLLVTAAVVGAQALLFQDGGLLALGWNLTNMGLVCGFTASAVHRAGARPRAEAGARWRVGAALAGTWLGTSLGSLATCLEVAASGATPLQVSLPAMLGLQAGPGLMEGLATAGAVAFLARARPSLLEEVPSQGQAAAAAVTALVLAGLGAAAAAADPVALWGLGALLLAAVPVTGAAWWLTRGS